MLANRMIRRIAANMRVCGLGLVEIYAGSRQRPWGDSQLGEHGAGEALCEPKPGPGEDQPLPAGNCNLPDPLPPVGEEGVAHLEQAIVACW